MILENNETWKRLVNYNIDDIDSELSFSKRLARDNNWSYKYTRRVIVEYKKFIFLVVHMKKSLTPSDEVDQVWHLHMLYTEEYWDKFCGTIVETKLHHHPTRGGNKEREKFYDWYTSTLDNYRSIFGNAPPDDIWPNLYDRFNRAPYYRRLNINEYLLISKNRLLNVSKMVLTVVFLLLAGFTMAASPDSDNDYSFVYILGFLMLFFIVLGMVHWQLKNNKKKNDRSSSTGNGGGGGGNFGSNESNTNGDSGSGDAGCGGCGGCGG